VGFRAGCEVSPQRCPEVPCLAGTARDNSRRDACWCSEDDARRAVTIHSLTCDDNRATTIATGRRNLIIATAGPCRRALELAANNDADDCSHYFSRLGTQDHE
jgi:hypothetical protein